MTRTEKIELLRELERQGAIRELCPEYDYWHYEVVKPAELPDSLREEYERLGELRW
jgi:hypothetical protein